MATPPSDNPSPDHHLPGPGQDAPKRGTPEKGGRRQDPGGESAGLRRVVIRPASSPDPIDSAFVVNRLTTLTHDLANLLDGSLRVITLARRSLAESGHGDGRANARQSDGFPIEMDALQHLGGQLATLHTAMAHMADLVRASMRGLSAEASVGGLAPCWGLTGSLADAIRHAVEVMRPIAEERGIRLECELSADVEMIASGSIYSVIVSTVRNAIESLERLGGCDRDAEADRVQVRAEVEAGVAGPVVVIEVRDNGAGISRQAQDRPSDVFRLGYTTKPGGSGVGLAISFDVVRQLGGSIELTPLARDEATGRGGAVVRVRYPAPRSDDDRLQARVPAA